jgi:hypothetical protein
MIHLHSHFLHTLVLMTWILVVALFGCVSAEWPAFERIRLRVDVDNRGDRSFIKLPAIGSNPSSRWIKFFLDATVDVSTIGEHSYTPSKTLKLAGINTTTGVHTWEDTWYFDRSASALQFVISASSNTSIIALGPRADIWTAFKFVEFCPFTGEVYLHRLPLKPEHMVCMRQHREHTSLECTSPAVCKWAVTDLGGTRNATLLIGPALTEEAMREQVPPYNFPSLSTDLTITKGGSLRFSDKPHVFAYSPTHTILGFAITDEVSTRPDACLALGILLFTYMYYTVHTRERISLMIARAHTSFVLFLAGYMYHQLMIGDKLRYMLITYDLWPNGMNITAIDWACVIIPCLAAFLFIVDVHMTPATLTLTHQSYRGILVTLTTLLPAFFFLLISFERINILVMVFVGILTTTCLMRDVTVAVFHQDRSGVHFFLYFLTWVAGVAPLLFLYPLTFYPLASEILLMAPSPDAFTRLTIVVHAIGTAFFTARANPPPWLDKAKLL